MARVFISCAGVDRVRARRLAEALRRAGHEPWLADDEGLVGESIQATIERGLRESDCVVLCLSQAALASSGVRAEWSSLLERELPGEQRRILIARFEPVDPPGELAQLAYSDLFPGELGWEIGVRRLLRSMEVHEAPRTEIDESDESTRRQVAETLQWLANAVNAAKIQEIESSREQVEAARKAARRLGDERTWTRITALLGEHESSRGQLASARALLEDALAQAERLVPPDPLLCANILAGLAVTLRERGDALVAKPLLERAIEIQRAELGAEHPRVLQTESHLAEILIALGDLAGARERLVRNLAILDRSLGAEHPGEEIPRDGLATTLVHLGIVLIAEGDLHGARIHFERALSLREETFGTEHPVVAETLSNLGLVSLRMGDAASAQSLLVRALRIQERTAGSEDPLNGVILGNLALALFVAGDLDGARQAGERALAIHEKVLGTEHPEVARDLANLGRIVKARGDLSRAREYLQRAVAIEERSLGKDHPLLTKDLLSLAHVEQAAGRRDKARELLTRAQAIARATLPDDHPSRAQIERDLFWLGTSSPYAPVPGPAQAALDAALRSLPPDGRAPPGYDDALRQALDSAERANDKPNAARAALLLGSTLGERGAWVEAQQVIDRARGFAEQTDDRLLQAEAYRLLGSALLQGSAYEDAWLAYNEAIRRFESLGDQQRATRTRLLLVPLLLQFGHLAPAGPHLEALRSAAQGELPDTLRGDLERVVRLGELAASAAKH